MDKKGVLERRWERISGLNRVLPGVCALAALAAGLDLTLWFTREWNPPMEAFLPRLEELSRPLEEIPPLKWAAGLFPSSGAEGFPKGSVPQLAPAEIQWKLKGVQMGDFPRAYLEDSKTNAGVWVKMGEKLDHRTVGKIQERSVLLEEEGGGLYELRM